MALKEIAVPSLALKAVSSVKLPSLAISLALQAPAFMALTELANRAHGTTIEGIKDKNRAKGV
jgi:hypothetical protein